MPGVFRPTTLTDVLGTLNQQSTATSDVINGLAAFAEADEVAVVTDSVAASTQTAPVWDATTWGCAVWG
jgi:hypothetical protein